MIHVLLVIGFCGEGGWGFLPPSQLFYYILNLIILLPLIALIYLLSSTFDSIITHTKETVNLIFFVTIGGGVSETPVYVTTRIVPPYL